VATDWFVSRGKVAPDDDWSLDRGLVACVGHGSGRDQWCEPVYDDHRRFDHPDAGAVGQHRSDLRVEEGNWKQTDLSTSSTAIYVITQEDAHAYRD